MRVRAGVLLLTADGGEGSRSVHATADGQHSGQRSRSEIENSFQQRLARAVAGGNHTAVFGSAAEAVKHPPGFGRDLTNSPFALTLVAQKRGHHADELGPAFPQDDTPTVRDRF